MSREQSPLILTAADAQALSIRERVGLAVARLSPQAMMQAFRVAEEVGVHQVWSTQSTSQADTLTVYAAIGAQTRTIRLGTAIVPVYPRHPLTMAAQVLMINDVAPGRLRLGLGPSHRPVIEGMYGIEMLKPLEYLHEYVDIVRAALWEGQVDYQGSFFNVHATIPRLAQTPILTSVLRENAFKLAGEISDGAISWLCPVPYLLKSGLPALRAAAQARGRPAPPLIAHILVSTSEDRPAVVQATRAQIAYAGKLPFYRAMFADAGYPVSEDGSMSDELVGSLVISGSPAVISERLKGLLVSGLDELLVWPVAVQQAESELYAMMRLIGSL